MAEIRYEAKPSFRDLRGRFTVANRELLENYRGMLRDEGRRLVGIMREEAPKDTGEFARGIRFQTRNQGDTVILSTSVPQPLGTWIVGGTQPHTIVPRGSGYPLRFVVGGQAVYTYRVNHPGTKPNPFPTRANARWIPGAQVSLNKVALRWVSTVSD